MKKFLSIMLAIIIACSVCAMSVSATEVSDTCGKNLTWTFDQETGTLTISGTGEMYDYDYDDDRPWEIYEDNIKIVIINNDVTTIGDNAFFWHTRLTAVAIPDSVTTIGDNAFSNCKSLTDITIPDSVISIGFSAFDNCESLTNIILPNSLTIINDSTFAGCRSITNISIPDKVEIIDFGAFIHCENLTDITIPNSVAVINSRAFDYCTSLTNIYYSGTEEEWTNISIGDTNDLLSNATIRFNTNSSDMYKRFSWSFNETTGELIISGTGVMYNYNPNNRPWSSFKDDIKAVVISEGITTVGDYSFYNCDNLENIIISNDVTSIGIGSFAFCSNLKSATIGAQTTKINPMAFYECINLADVYYPDTEDKWNTIQIDNTSNGNDPLINATIHYNYNTTESVLMGDANNDGKVSALDARLTLQCSTNILEFTDYQIRVADINKDGKITAIDARKILQIAVNA